MVRLTALLLLLLPLTAVAGTTTSRQIDSIQNSVGGGALSVPSTGSALATDSNTMTFTNKTWNGVAIGAAYGGAGTAFQEALVACNGSTTSFTLSHTPASNAGLRVSLDGATLQQGAGLNYTVSGTTITLSAACAAGQLLYADYTY